MDTPESTMDAEQFGKFQELKNIFKNGLTEGKDAENPKDKDASKFLQPGHAFKHQFQSADQIKDLDWAVSYYEGALDLRPAGHSDRSIFLNSLADSLSTRYKQIGAMEDLEKAISHYEEALGLCLPGLPGRSSSLNRLADSLFTRHKKIGTTEDLNKAIRCYTEALHLCPPAHPGRFGSLNSLAAALSTRYKQVGVMSDLKAAINHCEEALDLCPPGHPSRSASLRKLADCLSTRYKDIGKIEDLEKAICLDEEALGLYPQGHPGKSASLSNLVDCLSTRYKQIGEMADLKAAINHSEEALSLYPSGDSGRSAALSKLADCLSTRYKEIGEIEDLEKAIYLDEKALGLYPHGHPGRSATLSNLVDCLSTRYKQIGDMQDLEKAISLNEEALGLYSHGHPGKSASLRTLADCLSIRYKKIGEMKDLEKAISLDKELLGLYPHGHPGRSASLSNLANSLSIRYKQIGNMEDLEGAISHYEEALQWCPPSHPGRSSSLTNLAHSLSSRYKQTGEMKDIENAIIHYKETLELCPPGHPGRSLSLSNLTNSLSTRLQHSISKSTQQLMANLAFECVTAKRAELINTLTRYGWEGSYLVQVGFNAELLHLGQGVLQEIYIFLEFELNPAIAEQLATLFDPFPVTIYTPEEHHYIPTPPVNGSIWDLWMVHGIYQRNIGSQAAAGLVDGSGATSGSTGGGFAHTGGSIGSNNDQSGQSDQGDKGAGHGPPNRPGDSSDGYDGAGGNANNILNTNADSDRPRTREVNFSFSSTLTCSGEALHVPIKFMTNATVEIKMEENYKSKSRPVDSNWGGPWLEAKMTQLGARILTVPAGKLEYHLDSSQIHFIASGATSSIINPTPLIVRNKEDKVTSKTERNTVVGLQMVMGPHPSAQVDATHGRTSGEERNQKRWGVMEHRLPSHKNNVTGAQQTMVIWKYTHNPNMELYPPEAQNIFEPTPAATFGLNHTLEPWPCLEVEVVTSYSWLAPSPGKAFLDLFRSHAKPKNRPPAFLNFLHQTSVVIDLEKVKESNTWLAGLDLHEELSVKTTKLGYVGKKTTKQLVGNNGFSDCHVSLQAALHGHIVLSEIMKTDAQPLLESLQRGSPTPYEESKVSAGLLTPAPSPIPTGNVGPPQGTLVPEC